MGLVDQRPVVCPNLATGFWVPLQLVRLSLSVFRLVLVMVSLVVQMVGGGKGDPYRGVVVAFGQRWCFWWCS